MISENEPISHTRTVAQSKTQQHLIARHQKFLSISIYKSRTQNIICFQNTNVDLFTNEGFMCKIFGQFVAHGVILCYRNFNFALDHKIFYHRTNYHQFTHISLPFVLFKCQMQNHLFLLGFQHPIQVLLTVSSDNMPHLFDQVIFISSHLLWRQFWFFDQITDKLARQSREWLIFLHPLRSKSGYLCE